MSKAKSEEVMVVNNQSHTVFFPGAKLRPGVNSVPRKVAEAMKANPHISKLVAISISDAPPATKGLDVDKAVELVGKTHDDSLLHGYQAEDGRPAGIFCSCTGHSTTTASEPSIAGSSEAARRTT